MSQPQDLQEEIYGRTPVPLWPAGSLREPHSEVIVMLRHRPWVPRWDASGRPVADWLETEAGEALLTETAECHMELEQ